MTEELRKKFHEFDCKNPDIYAEFRAMSIRLWKHGRRRYGAWALFNVIRWNRDIDTFGDVFKIRNDFIALYSRKLIREQPKFRTFFGIKPLKAR